MIKHFKHIALGGTFDFFHVGHEKFLNKAFEVSDYVSVGIVSDKFAYKLKKNNFQEYRTRSSLVRKFLNNKIYKGRFRISKLDDLYGEALWDKNIEAILVTPETRPGAERINARRKRLNLPLLTIVEFGFVSVDGVKVSSTLIRKGQINSDGINFSKFLLKHDFFLPLTLRKELSEPFGQILRASPTNIVNEIIAVGDRTVLDFLKAGITPKLSIVDLKIQRESIFNSIESYGFKNVKILKVINKPGEIRRNLSRSVLETYLENDKSVILVEGEEDLAALPAVLMAPIPSFVFYGLRGKGLVKISVDLNVKEAFLKLLKKFHRY